MLNKKVEIFRNIDFHVVSQDDLHYQVWIRNQRQPEKDKLVLPNTSRQVVIAIIEEIKKFKKNHFSR